MPTSVEVYKLFIASPGGLEAERTAVQEEVARFSNLFLDIGIAFDACGWEDVAGGARRPQEMINELVKRCDYMILLLGSRWGSQPANAERFASGTEEEFHLAMSCIDQAAYPMTDILVLFKGVPEAQLNDPGPQLRRVLDFKQELEDSKRFLYKTFDDVEGLRREVWTRLHGWARARRCLQRILVSDDVARGSSLRVV